MIVMKFGGSSVADREQIEKVCEIVRSRADQTPILVSSAHKGITNALVEAAQEASRGNPRPELVIDKQQAIADSLECPADLLTSHYEELSDLLRGIGLIREITPRSMDFVTSFGERMAVRTIGYHMARQGLKVQPFDIWDVGFITDSNHGSARPIKGLQARMRKAIEPLLESGVIPLLTGYVGKNEEGEITTVGRNGSDLTATLVGAALGVEEVQIWTDTNGVMTADPRRVSNARSVPEMSFQEAAELAWFGGRVLHPSSLMPALKKRIPVRVLNTNKPDHPGTVIRDVVEGEPLGPATSIAHKSGQSVVTLETTSMLGETGYLGRVFEIVGRHGVDIDMVATSEVSISMTTERIDDLNGALKELEKLGTCRVHTGKAILCVVGRKLSEAKGLGARVFKVLAESEVNVQMISHGSGSINLTMLIDESDVELAVQRLHDELFE